MVDQWDMQLLWENRNVLLPIEIDEKSGSLQVVWHEIHNLDVSVEENQDAILISANDSM